MTLIINTIDIIFYHIQIYIKVKACIKVFLDTGL